MPGGVTGTAREGLPMSILGRSLTSLYGRPVGPFLGRLIRSQSTLEMLIGDLKIVLLGDDF